ncbi:hypothetical protein M3667_14475 [Microbacterium sp. P26]|uniref:hypothetical protein n=1 Tax=Microbacterium TaxID=33882 RepID=UPI00203F5479|nr:hypothetical protein [Microbacterium sp. P26]MCM3503074.1 hypothetical protein [Microbacterium sp. P26]
MFAAFFEGIMPGLRSLRPPIFAGFLWSLFIWILLAPQLPSQREAEGWAAQAYAVFGAIGAAGIAVVAAVVAFLVGVTALALSEPISGFVGRVGSRVRETLAWQFWARSRRKQLATQRLQAETALKKMSKKKDSSLSGRSSQQRIFDQTESSHAYYSGGAGFARRLFTPQTRRAVAALGEKSSPQSSAEGSVIQRITSEAFAAAAHREGMLLRDIEY